MIADAPPAVASETPPETAPAAYVCSQCGRSFASPQGLGRHVTSMHSANRRKRTRQASTRAHDGQLDTDRLLKALFPTGIPAKTEVITRTSAWLEEAKSLRSEG